MKATKLYIAISLMAATVGFSSCDSYLDKLPDNRMELKSPDDVSKLLVGAYSEASAAYLLEMYSDNTNEYKNTGWTAYNRFQDQAYNWTECTESDNEGTQMIWDAYYACVRTANEAIGFIRKQPNQDEYKAQLGEALVVRAYSMFYLSTVFCRAYDPATAGKELGLPYPTEPDYALITKYERGTLADLYKNIEADLKEGMPLLTNTYEHPKFHFNPASANAFAARFYLYYRKYDEAIKCATAVLGTNPATKLRDWAAWNALTANAMVQPNAYVSSSNGANLMLQVAYSVWGYNSVLTGCKYAHGARISQTETLEAPGPWGNTDDVTGYKVFYNNAYSQHCLRKIPLLIEYTDVQAGTGFAHAEFSVFNTDETLLVRAEAYALKGEYDNALADLNTELSKFAPGAKALTLTGIADYYGNLDYYTPQNPTPIKELHVTPALETTTQEPLIQAILQLRRVITIHDGLRMQDVKRYGMTIYRLRLDESNSLQAVTDEMTASDPRQAVQIPSDVINAGLTPNPRNSSK